MLFVYVDQSGSLATRDDVLRPTIAGVIMPAECVNEATQTLLSLKRDVCPRDPDHYELKAGKLLRPSAGGWKLELVERFFSEYLPSTDLKVSAIVMRRPSDVISPGERLELPHVWLLSKVVESMRLECSDAELALFVYDATGTAEDIRLSRAFTGFLYRHRKGQEFLARVVPTPLFGNSELVPGIQIADMIAGCLRHQAEAYDRRRQTGAEDHDSKANLSRLTRYLNAVQKKEVNLSAGQHAIYYVSNKAMDLVVQHAEGEEVETDVEKLPEK